MSDFGCLAHSSSIWQMMTICSAEYRDISHVCYDFWKEKEYKDEELCTKHRCYKRQRATESLTWNQAQKKCSLQGGYLVTLNSFEELQVLQIILMNEVSCRGQTSIYIGLQLQQQQNQERQHLQKQKDQQKQQKVSDHKEC